MNMIVHHNEYDLYVIILLVRYVSLAIQYCGFCPWDLHVADVGQGLSLPQGLSQFNCLTVEQIIPTFWHVEPTFILQLSIT